MLYLQPEGFVHGPAAADLIAAGAARPLAGAGAFTAARLWRTPAEGPAAPARPLAALPESALADEAAPALARLAAARLPFAGLPLDRPWLMGIVNVTPDSFSDGGDHADPAAAIAHGRALRAEGAAILDIGGESTRPGSAPTAVETEIARVVPVIEALAADGALVSVDTRRTAVMRAGLAAGARIVNDITALAAEDALAAVAEAGAAVVLMHMQGEPGTMQRDPRYVHAPSEVLDFLAARIAACEAAGIPRARIAVDPGYGFGKTLRHNVELVRAAGLFRTLGVAVLYGVSRKSSLGRMIGGSPPPQPKELGPASLALGLEALARGADILRVHDVAPHAQALAVQAALHQPVLD